ncbi:MAG: hypothetical protein KAU36_06040, partial [candidate division Zixibacteria bacterium]|nr:hypothetical protein [candidate division Zixibacteria bacterium]
MSRFLFHCLPLLLALLYHPAALSEGITFSEPHMVDTDIRYSQVQNPNPRALIGDGIIGRGQNCNLILSSSAISGGVWSMVTTDFHGNLLDSVPVPLLSGELSTPLTRLFEVYDVIWSEPYFYVIGRPNVDYPGLATYGLCYIRVTDELEVVDDTPVPFMPAMYERYVMFADDAAHLWAVSKNVYNPDTVFRFDFVNDMLVQHSSVGLPLERSAVAAVPTDTGVLIVALPDGSRSHVCYSLSLADELSVLDTIAFDPAEPYLPYCYEMLPYGNDSAVACFFDLDASEQPLFRYYFVTADQAAMDGVIYDIPVLYLPGDRDEATVGYSVNGHQLTAISDKQPLDELDIAIFRFDLAAAELVSAETVDGVHTPLARGFYGCTFDDFTALYYYAHYDSLIQLSYTLDDPVNTVSYKPALYTAKHYRTPSIALDDEGILMYAQCVDSSGPRLVGFRIADPSQPEITNSFEVLDETYRPHSPDIRIFGDKRILFWLEDVSEIDPSIYSPFHLQHRFVLMDDDQPSPEELANQDSLFSTKPSSDHISPYCPVLGAAQVGSQIFFDVAYYLSPWEIFDNGSWVVTRSLDLTSGSLTSYKWNRRTNGCTGLSSHGDS